MDSFSTLGLGYTSPLLQITWNSRNTDCYNRLNQYLWMYQNVIIDRFIMESIFIARLHKLQG